MIPGAHPTAAYQPLPAVAVDQRPWFQKKRVLIPSISVIVLVFVVVAGVLVGRSLPEPATPTPSISGIGEVNPFEVGGTGADELLEEPAGTVADPGQPVTVVDAADLTIEQQQAIKQAESYMTFTAFSRQGLIDQLEFEGFSIADATVAVDHMEIDWADQAVKKAKSYLKYTAFSYSGLVEMLEYEGFSSGDATYAADHVGADWMEQAALKAEDYLKYSTFSRSELIDQLEFEGFTREQAEYGAASAGL